MSANEKGLGFLQRHLQLAGASSDPAKEVRGELDSEEESCPAFGFLRGIKDRALAVEFRLRNGNSEWYPYAWLGPWQHNPSVGLLLKFSGDVITLVLIRGSNLDAIVPGRGVNLTDRGFQRHRVTWVREMEEEELQKTGDKGPTIDCIEIGEFESQDEVREWVKTHAPGFIRRPVKGD